MTAQNQLKFCEQVVVIDMQLARQEFPSSRKYSWSQAPSKNFLVQDLEQTAMISRPKFFHGLLHCQRTFPSQSLIQL